MEDRNYGQLIIFFIIITIIFIVILNMSLGLTCKIKAIGDDKYCKKVYNYYSNLSNDYSISWEVKSKSQDLINEENRRIAQEKTKEQQKIKQECYDNGEDYNISLDIINDYGYNCKKIEYINDHFIDKTRQVDGGYIEGSSSGFVLGYTIGFNSGYTSGKFYDYVTERVLATGQLVENTQFHIDCNGEKSNEKINYYTESEFVMYYVDNCIK